MDNLLPNGLTKRIPREKADGVIQQKVELETDQQSSNKTEPTENRKLDSSGLIKDEFLAFFLHELRTPLNLVLGWTRLLQDGRLDQEQNAKALETIGRNAQFLNELIEDLLDVARIASGKMEIIKTKIDFRKMIENLIEDFTPLAISKSVVLIASFSEPRTEIFGEAKRLKQIVGNLLANALKFTPSGGYIVVDLSHQGDAAQLLVKDSGIGIKPELLPHIYDCFRQGTQNHGSNKGLGIGLTVARHLTELHGGNISAHSDGANQGTTLTVNFPLVAH